MNKNGIELSVNFLVTFVLSITIFGFGIYFATTISDEAFNQADVTEQFLNQRIQEIACSSKDKVCISNNYATLRRGDTHAVGIFINNYESTPDERTIQINWIQSNNRAYQDDVAAPDVTGSDFPPLLIPAPQKTIDARTVDYIGFGLYIPTSAKSAKYVYTLEIEDVTPSLGSDERLPPIREKVTFYVE